ncbi:diacylglycerol lipase-beta [Impatiens glandulifera]|uniref:diacylglycerol lipase-beta n=1 Tax=Impatiens glandulifera TaxID=253017 RepID=UPI001FB08B8F|nr:diacylglycerol lipase-beta [Impatiens glandulifera]
MAPLVAKLENVRFCTIITGVSNLLVIFLGSITMAIVYPACGLRDLALFMVIMFVSAVRIIVLIRTGIAQKATATMMAGLSMENVSLDAAMRQERRARYKRWIFWVRFLLLTTIVQFSVAAGLVLILIKHSAKGGTSTNCVIGYISHGNDWQKLVMVPFLFIVFSLALIQCFTGSEVLRWRSFYASENKIWKAHYREVFDNGIREALCCLGRFKYLSILEEDEVYSVAQLLGDLVAYRASGTGHLEFIAGLALLQRNNAGLKPYEGSLEAPDELIEDATIFHPFAEAAYTGLLLDVGRNPISFPCAWLYRQGIFTPWSRNRRPELRGDNWWRGHAAAYLKYVNVPPEALRQGRVNQSKCEAAYFIVVLHHLKSLVIAVRGTETPEDLITDGLGKECILSAEDLEGLLNVDLIPEDIRQRVISSMPHYGHSGIVEAARDLFMQVEGNPMPADYTMSLGSRGFLSSLLGAGCECEGYKIRIVGHSLGGAVSAMLGLKLYGRFPNVHVYAYGPLPCVDPVIADACSNFITSIVYDNEFSSRLSVASLMRLRAAALSAVSERTTDSTIISKLARRFFFLTTMEISDFQEKAVPVSETSTLTARDIKRVEHDNNNNMRQTTEELNNPLFAPPDISTMYGDPATEFLETVLRPERGSVGDVPETFLPGFIIHIVPEGNQFEMFGWRNWILENTHKFKAYVATREDFMEIIVSRRMFLDHLPWRCQYALTKVIQTRNNQAVDDDGLQMA